MDSSVFVTRTIFLPNFSCHRNTSFCNTFQAGAVRGWPSLSAASKTSVLRGSVGRPLQPVHMSSTTRSPPGGSSMSQKPESISLDAAMLRGNKVGSVECFGYTSKHPSPRDQLIDDSRCPCMRMEQSSQSFAGLKQPIGKVIS